MPMKTKKEERIAQYKRELEAMKSQSDDFFDLFNYTVDFAKKYHLTGEDMESVVPSELVIGVKPTVLDAIDATEEFPVE